jgi:hypothetical protein
MQTDVIVKLIVGAGQASPSPPVGPALGSKGVKSMDFCKVCTVISFTCGMLTTQSAGVQCANSKLHNRHPNPRPHHRPSRP